MAEKLTTLEKRKFAKLSALYIKRLENWLDTANKVLSYYSADCDRCARCCINIPTEFTDHELEQIIKRSGLKASEFAEKYTYLYTDGLNRLRVPCSLLIDNKCSMYDIRPKACRIYPLCFPFSVYDVEHCELAKK